jgi:hypothetical protein
LLGTNALAYLASSFATKKKGFIKLPPGDAQRHRHPDRELGGENSGFEQTGFLNIFGATTFLQDDICTFW